MLPDNRNSVSTKCHHSSHQIDAVIGVFWFCSYVGLLCALALIYFFYGNNKHK